MCRARRKQTPTQPTTLDDIRLHGKWTETVTGDRLLLFDDSEQTNRMTVFTTSENLTALSAAKIFYCDGTFYTCPSMFHQIYSIHIMIDGTMTPVVYALLPGESQFVSTRFFTLLKEHMSRLNLSFTPTRAFADFKVAVHNAIRQVIPGIIIKGCFFHFTQCVWKKAQTTGLQIFYRDNEEVRTLIRRAAVLPPIPLDRMEDVWFQALEDLEDADIPHDTQPFTDYITE